MDDRYKITAEDEDSKSWISLLDFDSPVQLESDWYSTETFKVFLDALDINQPTSLRAGASSASSKSNLDKTITTPQKKLNSETILSAEALKIISELPDLSHMSSKSFIFPNNPKSSKTTPNKR